MKICMISMEFPPYPSYIAAGGVGIHTVYLSKSLARLGHEVHVIACGDREFCELIDGVYVHRISSLPSRLFRVPVFSLKAAKKFRVLNKKIKFDIIHNQSPYGFFEAYVHKIDSKVKMVTTIHAIPLRELVNSRLARDPLNHQKFKNLLETLTLLIEQILFSKVEYFVSDKIIAVSGNIKNDLINTFNIKAQKIQVIHNGIDGEEFNPNVDNTKIKINRGLKDAKVVLFVGRLERIKGLYLLIDVAKQIIREKSNVYFLIVGSGVHEDELAKMGDALEGRVIFTGRVPHELLPFYYSTADVVVIPSLYAGCPLTLLEAMASAKPIVTTIADFDNYFDNIEKQVVLVKEANNSGVLAQKIIDLLSNEEYQAELGSSARLKVLECLTWEKIATETSKLYKHLLD